MSSMVEDDKTPTTTKEFTAPAPRLLIRSKLKGIECLAAPNSREDGQTLGAAAAHGVDFEGRSLVVTSPEGSWIAVSGGPKPIALFATRGDEAGRSTLSADTAECDRFSFSPLGTYVVTWQRPSPEKFPEGSLRVWRSSTGALLRSFHAKLLNKGGIPATLAWSGDEKVAMHAVTNTVQVHAGDFAVGDNGGGGQGDGSSSSKKNDQIGSIPCPSVASFSASPCASPPYHAALFVPESKGKPATVKIFAFPPAAAGPADGLVVSKSFFRAQEVKMKWSPTGLGVLVQTHTDVDATGTSYYGGTGLYLLHAAVRSNGESFECLVPLPKEGPIADAAWAPNGREFVVIAGSIPPVAALYNAEAKAVFNFGAAHRNTVSWSPHGRFVALAGFGNLAGDVDFWDRHKKKKLGARNCSCAVEYGWSPDSRQFMVATTAPRMNVDNGVKIYRYDGSGPVATLADRAPLWDACWVPAPADLYPDRGASPGRKARTAEANGGGDDPAIAETTKTRAYVPPGARGRGSSLADAIRADREKSMGGAGKTIPSASASKGEVPGMSAPPVESRNKKRKEAAKKRAEAEAAAAALEKAVTQAEKPPAPPADEDLGEAELTKKKKGVAKKLKQVQDLQAKVDSGEVKPSAEQKDKLSRGAALEAELAEIEKLLTKF